MTTASEFHSQLVDLASDPAVAGLSLTGAYESLTGPTVTPPAGTIRQDGKVVGIFTTAHGEQAATIDSWARWPRAARRSWRDGFAVRPSPTT